MKRYKHNLSHYHLTTADMGQLIPVGCVEALPGDTVQHNTSVLVRMSPLAAPVMHPVQARVHHFFVPTRWIWDKSSLTSGTWEDFITGGADGMDAQTVPTLQTSGQANDLWDHLGMPRVAGINVNAIPIACINAIYNEYYRDQDLVEERAWDDVTVPRIAWEKDYFTSARPWTQKGPEVTVPLGDVAPVKGIGYGTGQDMNLSDVFVHEAGPTDKTYQTAVKMDDNAPGVFYVEDGYGGNYPNIYADLAEATGGNINDIRRAFAIQRFQEARARYGSRLTEYLRYMGVTPQDARLQRPEFLGGGRAAINFSEVIQTAPEIQQEQEREFGVGDLYGHGIAAMRSNAYRRFMPEHGFIITLLSVRPKSIYTDGIPRQWLKQHKEDFWQKELQWIGQQEVYNDEVYADPATGREVFGYQDRYSEYRSHPSQVSAEFRDVLNYWHLGRQFESAPGLNQSFTDCVPSKRIFNEQTQDSLWIMCQHKMVARRMVARSAAPRIF